MAAAVTGEVPAGLLVGGQPAAILAASSALHEAAMRTDDIAFELARALGPAATTVAAALPFAPAQAVAVRYQLEAVLARPGCGLGQMAAAYEVGATELRFAGQALEAAGMAGTFASGGLLLLGGARPEVLADTTGVDLRREAVSLGGSAGPVGMGQTLGVRVVEGADGTTFYVVELSLTGKEAASLGVQVNGVGGFVEGAEGADVTARWALPTRADAEMVLAALGGGVLAGLALGTLPPPTETTVGGFVSGTLVGTAPVPVAGGAAAVTGRHETTVLADGSTRTSLTISGGGHAALVGLAGVGGAASLRLTVDRDPAGRLTGVTLTTSEEHDRGRHGMAVVESLNREATVTEREWSLELTPELVARAEEVAAAVAAGRAPDPADVQALADAVTGLTPTVRTYDARHQQLSVDVSLGRINAGGSVGVDTAVLRTP